MDRTGPASTTAAEIALAAMRASVFGTDPMAPAPPVSPSIVAPTAPKAPVNASPHNGSKNPADLGDFLETAGLLEYDPEAISRIYAGHPQRLARRLRQTLIPIGLFLLGVGSDKLTGQLKLPERARARARRQQGQNRSSRYSELSVPKTVVDSARPSASTVISGARSDTVTGPDMERISLLSLFPIAVTGP